MDLMLLELLLWIGLLFFFWALREGLGRVESDIESLGLINNGRLRTQQGVRYCRPEQVAEPIGSYRGMHIYRYVVINGRSYQFDRVYPQGSNMTLEDGERCIEPGLVYQECVPARNLSNEP